MQCLVSADKPGEADPSAVPAVVSEDAGGDDLTERLQHLLQLLLVHRQRQVGQVEVCGILLLLLLTENTDTDTDDDDDDDCLLSRKLLPVSQGEHSVKQIFRSPSTDVTMRSAPLAPLRSPLEAAGEHRRHGYHNTQTTARHVCFKAARSPQRKTDVTEIFQLLASDLFDFV